jgi:hypothetical protein
MTMAFDTHAGESTIMKRSRRLLTVALGSLAVFVTAGGLLHTRPGIKLMARVGLACPAAAVSLAEAAALRDEGLAPLRGTTIAPSRYALGLALDGSRLTEARSWAKIRGAACVSRRRGFQLLICTREMAGAHEETTLAFDQHDHLIAVDVMTRVATSSSATSLFEQRGRVVAQVLGDTPERSGDITAVAQGRVPFATAVTRHRYRDYAATLSAVRLPSEILVREQYQSLLSPVGPAPRGV